MRVVALDLGSRRIGVAVSDPGGVLASPHSVVERSGDRIADLRAISQLCRELGAEAVVVGLPLSLDGSDGPAARQARAEAGELAAVLGVPVDTHDERLTTVTADRRLREAGLKGRARRQVVDQAAASVFLQAWLDARAAPAQSEQERKVAPQ